MLLSVVRMLVSRCRSGLGTLNKVVSFFRKGMHDLHPQESGIPGPALPCTGPRGGEGGFQGRWSLLSQIKPGEPQRQGVPKVPLGSAEKWRSDSLPRSEKLGQIPLPPSSPCQVGPQGLDQTPVVTAFG